MADSRVDVVKTDMDNEAIIEVTGNTTTLRDTNPWSSVTTMGSSHSFSDKPIIEGGESVRQTSDRGEEAGLRYGLYGYTEAFLNGNRRAIDKVISDRDARSSRSSPRYCRPHS